MKVVLQRVKQAKVTVAERDGHEIGDEVVGEIGQGLLILLGVEPNDGEAETRWMVEKVLSLRIFPDAEGGDKKPMNLDVRDINGAALVVSQFTLAADVAKGRRPSFTSAAAPEHAMAIYQRFIDLMAEVVPTQTGEFGADMDVSLVNDGPVTFILER